jgi:hypothetical protein
MEDWEQKRIDRLEKQVREIEAREYDARLRDGTRIHLNINYLLWIVVAAFVVAEIVVAVLHHAQQ